MTKVIKLAAILAILVCGQALGQANVQFTLGLGGDNGTPIYNPTAQVFSPFSPGDNADDQIFAGSEITWDVVTELTGEDTLSGIANITFDLELYAGEGEALTAVSGAWYSTVNSGAVAHPPQQNAAFCSSFDVAENGVITPATPNAGRAFDPCHNEATAALAGGPFMDYYNYPSSSAFPAGVIGGLADEGHRLVGMGCGYSHFEPTGIHAGYDFLFYYDCDYRDDPGPPEVDGSHTAGVGLDWVFPWGTGIGPVYDYWPGLGLTDTETSRKRPICEGQIDMSAHPAGTYTLKLVPGNCNALKTTFDPELTNPGAFAEEATGLDDVIVFNYQPPPVCDVDPTSLDFGLIDVDSFFDITFEITNDGGQTLTGTVSESCDHYSIISGEGAYSLTAGQTQVVTVRFQPTSPGVKLCTIDTGAECANVDCTGEGDAGVTPCGKPTVTGAVSSTMHGTVGPFTVALSDVGASAGIEMRFMKPSQIIVTFSDDIVEIDGDGLQQNDEVTLSSGTITGMSIAGNVLTINTAGVNGHACLSVLLQGLAKVDPGVCDTIDPDSVMLPETWYLRVHTGDSNKDGYVNVVDMSMQRVHVIMNAGPPPVQTTAANAQYDVNADGYINVVDMSITRVHVIQNAGPPPVLVSCP